MAITIDDVEALRRRLAELPRNQPREVSKQEAIALLATELGAARRRGYSPDQLAQLLSEQGVAINTATLRGYLRKTRRSRGRRGGKTGAAGMKAAAAAQPPRTDSTGVVTTPAAPAARTSSTASRSTAGAPANDVTSPAGPKDGTRAAR
jgi:hypothetical protein